MAASIIGRIIQPGLTEKLENLYQILPRGDSPSRSIVGNLTLALSHDWLDLQEYLLSMIDCSGFVCFACDKAQHLLMIID
jgi:hypothetical protein